MEQNTLEETLQLIKDKLPQPDYSQFKPIDPKSRIPNMSERAHKELQPVFRVMDAVKHCLAARDIVVLEQVAKEMFFICQNLIESKIELSHKIDELVKTMFNEITKAHLNHSKQNSLTNPSYRY